MMERKEQYLDALAKGELTANHIRLLSELSEDELREISFAHTLKGMGKESEPRREFTEKQRAALQGKFDAIYGKETLRRPFWQLVYPVSILAVFVLVVSLGFLSFGSKQLVKEETPLTPQIETLPPDETPAEVLLALDTTIAELDIFLIEEEGELDDMERDLLAYEDSFDGGFDALDEDLKTFLQ